MVEKYDSSASEFSDEIFVNTKVSRIIIHTHPNASYVLSDQGIESNRYFVIKINDETLIIAGEHDNVIDGIKYISQERKLMTQDKIHIKKCLFENKIKRIETSSHLLFYQEIKFLISYNCTVFCFGNVDNVELNENSIIKVVSNSKIENFTLNENSKIVLL